MLFNKLHLPNPDSALGHLARADRFAVAAGRFAVLAALAGAVATGAYLLLGKANPALIFHATLRGLHWLAGLVLLATFGWANVLNSSIT